MAEERAILLPDALRAQQALRAAAKLPEEHFPVAAFVGMVSDEVEALRARGMGDDAIAVLIRDSSGIEVSAAEIAEHYAEPEERGAHGG